MSGIIGCLRSGEVAKSSVALQIRGPGVPTSYSIDHGMAGFRLTVYCLGTFPFLIYKHCDDNEMR